MELKEAIKLRHTVRKFKADSIPEDIVAKINSRIEELNSRYNLSMRLVQDFNKGVWSILKFISKNTSNFVLLAIKEENDKQKEFLGYASSDLMLYIQTLGLNSWWIGGTYSNKVEQFASEGIVRGILVIGYGENQGKKHKSKTYEEVASYKGEPPSWFKDGVQAALDAPTAMNKQAFKIEGEDNKVKIIYKESGFSNEDLGIVKHHFEIGAGKDNFTFEE